MKKEVMAGKSACGTAMPVNVVQDAAAGLGGAPADEARHQQRLPLDLDQPPWELDKCPGCGFRNDNCNCDEPDRCEGCGRDPEECECP